MLEALVAGGAEGLILVRGGGGLILGGCGALGGSRS